MPAPNDAEEILQEQAIEADSEGFPCVNRFDRFRGFAAVLARCRYRDASRFKRQADAVVMFRSKQRDPSGGSAFPVSVAERLQGRTEIFHKQHELVWIEW